MSKASNFHLPSLISLALAGCTQVVGLSDYNVASEAPDAAIESPSTTPDAETDAADPGPVEDAEAGRPSPVPSATDMDAGADAAITLTPRADAALAAEDASQADALVGDDATGPSVDAGPSCAAPNTMCGDRCVAPDDPRHCGACDHDCTALANVSGAVSCSNGQCVVPQSACAKGFAHCSADVDDGCETDITLPAHCGGCTPACSSATPLCASGSGTPPYRCVTDCVAPTTKCGTACVDTSNSTAHCGGCDSPCPQVARATATCSSRQCGFVCNSGYHACGSQCLANDSPASCGSSCVPCSAPANAIATCTTAGSCDFTCNTGYHVCGAQCVANNSVSTCGSSCSPCTAPANASPICSATLSCDFTCNSGYHRCGNACARDDSVTQCGGSCQVCPQIANGAPQCVSGVCGTVCDGGGSLVNGVCKPRLAAKQLAVGAHHNCAIMADNTLRCWGSNQDHLTQLKHQLGPVPTANFSRTPVQVTGLVNVTQVTAGLAHTCAMASGGLVCWGDNQSWQLGPNSTGIASTASPVTIPLSNIKQIEASDFETCALLNDGTVTCWGSRDGGPLVADHGASDVVEISFSGTNTCERQSGGGARCFGSNAYGAIGVSPDVQPHAVTPVTVPGLANVTDITQGTYNACAVTSASGGRVWCWGAYSAVGPHQVGTTAAPPAEIPGVANARGVASGYTSTCAWTSSGTVYCWGSNAAGKLGQPLSLSETRTPTLVPNLNDVVELGIGNHHVCARTTDGWVKCWGQAVYGEIGPGTTSNNSYLPLTVPF